MDQTLTPPTRLEHKEIVLPDVPADGVIGERWTRSNGAPWFTPGEEPTYAENQAGRVETWHKTVAAYEADPGDFYAAYHWLNEHPVFWQFHAREPFPGNVHEKYLIDDQGMYNGVFIMVSKVDPATGEINEDDDAKNTKTEVWVELSFHEWPHAEDPADPNTIVSSVHAYTLDTGGDTYEQAIVNAAFNVWKAVGNDRRALDTDPNLGEPSNILVVDFDTFDAMMEGE